MLATWISSSSLFPALTATAAMAAACAVLSVFVVSRRWAFIGEGISHSGFGGAGTAWLAALLFPALERHLWLPYAGVVVFCLATALLIGWFTRGPRVNSDAVIGIFLVASLAWGFLARQIYVARTGRTPAGFDTLLFGYTHDVSPQFALLALLMAAAVVAAVALLSKEIISYCFDPMMAEAAGVRAGFVHYLLMLLVAMNIVIGARIVGTVLVTALLVLPGATALLLSDRLKTCMTAAVATALVGALAGALAQARWPMLPTGPVIVLALFVLFLLAFARDKGWRRVGM